MTSEKKKEVMVSEVGEIPSEWCLTDLDEVAEIKGRIGWRGYTVNDLKASGPLVIGATQITNENELDFTKSVFISEEKYQESPEIMINQNDILVVKVGNSIGKVAIVDNEIGKACINPNVVLLKRIKINPHFLFFHLTGKYSQNFLKSNSAASAQPALNQTTLKKLKVPVPPSAEQKEIASSINSIRMKIKTNQETNKVLAKAGEAIFKHWFVDFEFPNEDGKPYKASDGEMVSSELGKEIPEGWKVSCIENVAHVIGGGTPSTKVESYFTNNGIPWLTPKDLSGYEEKFIEKGATDLTEEGLKNSSARLMPKGTILFTSRAPIGYLVIALNDIATNQGFKSLVPKDNMKSEYLYHYIKKLTPYIQSISSGSTFGEVTGSTMKRIKILIPEYEILKKFEDVMSPINSRIINDILSAKTLTKIRDLLLPKLMSGKIRVPIVKDNVEAS